MYSADAVRIESMNGFVDAFSENMDGRQSRLKKFEQYEKVFECSAKIQSDLKPNLRPCVLASFLDNFSNP